MKRNFLLLCIIAFAFSCTSNDDTPAQPESNFYALTVGNTWVYKNYKYNSQTTEYETTGVVDSIKIVGTEVINGKTYFNFRRRTSGNENNITFCNPNGEHFELLRDSIGYLVKEDGSIKYANNDFSERLLQVNSWGNIYEKLIEANQNITVESGTFQCLDTERYARLSNEELSPGSDHFYYSNGIGLIYDTSSNVSSSFPTIKRRLDAYFVQ